jgi:prefoldin subunit 5
MREWKKSIKYIDKTVSKVNAKVSKLDSQIQNIKKILKEIETLITSKTEIYEIVITNQIKSLKKQHHL